MRFIGRTRNECIRHATGDFIFWMDAESMSMSFYDELPQSLRDLAYNSGEEFAWQRRQALQVIDFLSERRMPVSGIEVWLATIPGPTIPTPFIYQWPDITPDAEIDWNCYVTKANKLARQFIEDFQWDEQDKVHAKDLPYFNIVAEA